MLHRHSFENYLIEKEPVEQFRHNRAPLKDSLEKLQSSFCEIVQETELKFKELLILDVAHQRSKTSCKVLPRGADDFFAGKKTIDFDDSKIQGLLNKVATRIDEQSIDNARSLVEEFLNEHRFIDLLPGHFAFSIIKCWINRTANVRKRILEEDLRVYLSTEVWRLVNTPDHKSLKRRLRNAVREAERIRQTQQ